jgi:hypothetical protein
VTTEPTAESVLHPPLVLDDLLGKELFEGSRVRGGREVFLLELAREARIARVLSDLLALAPELLDALAELAHHLDVRLAAPPRLADERAQDVDRNRLRSSAPLTWILTRILARILGRLAVRRLTVRRIVHRVLLGRGKNRDLSTEGKPSHGKSQASRYFILDHRDRRYL